MSYTPATIYPTSLFIGQWSTPTNPNPRLASPISAGATTITVTAPLLDYTGAVVTSAFLFAIENPNGYAMQCYAPAGACSVDGLTLTGVVTGIRLTGLDWTTADTSLQIDMPQDAPVYVSVNAVERLMLSGAFTGTIASGGNNWKVGAGTANDINFEAYNDQTSKPKFYFDESAKRWKLSRGDDDGTAGASELSGFLQLTTAEIAALGELPAGGIAVYNTDTGVTYWREGGSWVPNASGATVANASETVAGKGQIPTDSERGLGTSLGSTGARLLVSNDALVKTSSGAGDENKLGVLGAGGVYAVGFMPTNVQEADTFFGTTNITGAEAETLSDGSDANSLHIHDIVTMIRSDARALTIDYFVLATATSGSITKSEPFLSLRTQASNIATAYSYAQSVTGSFQGKYPKCYGLYQLSQTTAQNGMFGFSSGGTTFPNNGVLTDDHAMFIIDDEKLYASVADGATQTKSADLAITLTDRNFFSIEQVGTHFLFYVNNVLKWTSTANEPNSSMVYWSAGISPTENVAKNLTLSHTLITQDI